MADQTTDLSKLSDEQLEAYQDLLQQDALKKAIDPMQGGTPPGPANIGVPLGLDPKNWAANWDRKKKLKDTDLVNPNEIQQDYQGKDAQGNNLWYIHPNAESRGRTIQGNVDAVSQLENKAGTAAASVATGLPWWATALNTATAQTPGDMYTTYAAGPLFKGLDKLQVANRAGNTALGATKGMAGYEGLSRLNDALNGRPQRAALPTSPRDIIGLVLSGLAGGAQGNIQAPKKLSTFDSKLSSHQNYLESLTDLNKQGAALDTAQAEAARDIHQANEGATQANARLNAHETQMKASAGDVKNAAQRQYRAQAAALEGDEKALRFQMSDAQDALTDAQNRADQYSKTLAGAQQHTTGTASDQISDQILAEQKRLDDLRNPDKAESLIGNHPNLQATNAEIARLQALDTSKYNKGAQTQVQNAIEKAQGLHDDLVQNTVRDEIDASKNRIRTLQDLRRRVEAGRAPGTNTPPDDMTAVQDWEDAQRQAQTIAGHQQNVTNAQNSLADLNAKYRAAVQARLQHAGNAPQATVADQSAVQTHQNLMDAAERARQAKVAAQARADNLDIQSSQLKEQISDLKDKATRGGYISNPAKTAGQQSREIVGNVLKHLIAPTIGAVGAGGHDQTSMLTLGPALGAALGMVGDFAASSRAGQNALRFVNTNVSPNATSLIPSLINQLSHTSTASKTAAQAARDQYQKNKAAASAAGAAKKPVQ